MSEEKQRPIFKFNQIQEGVYALDLNGLIGTTSTYTLEQIQTALQNKDVASLREMSRYFYITSGEYRRMVDYLSNIHTYRNIVSPVITEANKDMDKFEKYHQTIMNYSNKARIDETCRDITQSVIRDGVYYGYERELPDGSIIMQELPAKYCRSKYIINGVYSVEFDVKYFDTFRSAEDKLNVFNAMPEEFLTLYNEYKANPSGKDANWKMLNEEFARCHKLDSAETPLLCAVFPELLELQEYKNMNKIQNLLDLSTIVVQKLPFDKDRGVLVHELEAQMLHKNARQMMSNDNVDVWTTPCEVETIKLRNSNDTGRSKIDDAVSIVYNTTGTAQVLFNSGIGTGSIGLDRGLRVDESLIEPLMGQYEKWYNNRFNTIVSSKNFYFFIQFLGVTIFNEAEKVQMYKDLATLGYSKLAVAVASGIKQPNFISMLAYENDYLKLGEKMKPLQSTHTTNGTELSEQTSETKKEKKEIKPESEVAKDRETNKDRGLVKNA